MQAVTEVITVSDDDEVNQSEPKSHTEATEEARVEQQADKRPKTDAGEVKKHRKPSP